MKVEDELNLIDFLITLAKHKQLMLIIACVCTAVAVLVSLLLPARYTSQATIMPPTQSQSVASMMLGQFGMLAGGAAPASALGLKAPNDIYLGLLRSETIANELIEQFGLKNVYHVKRLGDARKILQKSSDISTTKEGLITITVTDHSAQRAADLANAYVKNLQKLTESLAVTEAGQRRLFFENQMKTAKNNLADAEVALRQDEEKTGMLQLDTQSRAIIESVAAVKAQIAAKQVQIESLRSFATDQNSEVKLAQSQLSALQVELNKLLRNSGPENGDIGIPTQKLPEAGLEYIRRYRDVKYNETIFELLAKQYEAAKIDEAKEGSVIQVVDPAAPPEIKSGPRKSLIVAIAFLISIILGVLLAMTCEALKKALGSLEQQKRIELLKSYLRTSGGHKGM